MTKIDIFSGFLGAGKTTFIKKLIEEAYKGEKIVLIENEFGTIGIDSGFLQDSGIQIAEMNSGCICCSLVGDFSKALSEVIATYHPDRILIEPSGVGKLSDVTKAVLSAELDGANYLHKTLKITIPMSTAMLFYVVVTSIIGGLQTFGSVYPLTKSVQGIGNALDFIVVIIYEEAYENGELSIACALSWVLFAIIAVFTAIIFKTSKWVYYGEEM